RISRTSSPRVEASSRSSCCWVISFHSLGRENDRPDRGGRVEHKPPHGWRGLTKKAVSAGVFARVPAGTVRAWEASATSDRRYPPEGWKLSAAASGSTQKYRVELLTTGSPGAAK